MGIPKGELTIGGRPILQYLLERMPWPGERWVISAPGREHPPGAECFDREWVDPVAGLGPLRGILTALEHLAAPILVVATVDMPGITSKHPTWLADQLRGNPSLLGAMCRRGPGPHQEIEPFPIALRKQAEAVLRERLESGQRSVHRLLDDARFMAVPAPPEWEPAVWVNLNTPADVQGWETAPDPL